MYNMIKMDWSSTMLVAIPLPCFCLPRSWQKGDGFWVFQWLSHCDRLKHHPTTSTWDEKHVKIMFILSWTKFQFLQDFWNPPLFYCAHLALQQWLKAWPPMAGPINNPADMPICMGARVRAEFRGCEMSVTYIPSDKRSTRHVTGTSTDSGHTKNDGKLPFVMDFPIKNNDFP